MFTGILGRAFKLQVFFQNFYRTVFSPTIEALKLEICTNNLMPKLYKEIWVFVRQNARKERS